MMVHLGKYVLCLTVRPDLFAHVWTTTNLDYRVAQKECNTYDQ